MTNDYWGEAVYAVPPLEGLDRCDASAAFDWLSLHFPVDGTKIDWQRVPGRHLHWKVADDMRLASMTSIEVRQRIRPGLIVEHVGDGLSPFGVRFTDYNASSIIAALLEIPEHHYFLAGDRSWIIVVTTEGDLDVVDDLYLEEL